MKLRSFRWRIVLLSAALAGGALASFALLSSWLIYNSKLEQLDAELESQLAQVPRRENRLALEDAITRRLGLRDDSLRHDNRLALEEAITRRLGLRDEDQLAVLWADPDGQVIYCSEPCPEVLNRPWPALPLEVRRRVFDERLPLESRRRIFGERSSQRIPSPAPPPPPRPIQKQQLGLWRVAARQTPRGTIAIAVSLRAIRQDMAAIRSIFLITIPGILLLIAGGAWALSGRALTPVRRLSATIRQVTAQGLDQRVPFANADLEFVELINVFNQMLGRLQRSFNQASRFSGDAAHELKTPLAILQGELEQAIQQVDAGSPMQQTLANLLDEVRRLSSIVRKLLLLSLADAGHLSLQRTPVDMSELLEEQLEDLPWLAPELTIEPKIATGLKIKGDRDLMVQVIQNLLSNAVKYNLPSGWIRVNAQQQEHTIAITIENAAPAIAPADRERLFDRFYRGDPARTRSTEGIGLGLSLAREIARAHGGDLVLLKAQDGVARFQLSLPAPAKQ